MSLVPVLSSSRDSVPLCRPEDVAAGGAAPPAHAVAPSSVQPFRDNDASRSWVGAQLEDAARAVLERMPPGGAAELSTEGTLRLKLAGETAGKLKVKREQDGSYAVTVQGRGGAGLGVGAGLGAGAKGATAAASGMMGLSGALTLRFATAEEAADRLAALAQRPNPHDMLGRGLVAVGLLDADATQRSLAALGNVSRFEVGLYGQLKAKLEALVVKLDARTTGEVRLRLDLERNSVTFEAARDLSLLAKASLTPHTLGAAKLTPATTLAEAQVLQQDTLRLETRLRPGELQQLQRGQLDPSTLLTPERLEVTLVQTRELDVAGAHVQAQRAFPVKGPLPPEALDPDLGLWEVRAGVDAGAGYELDLKTGALDLKAEARLEVPLFGAAPVRLPLSHVAEAVRAQLQEQQREDALVQAQLAASRAR